MNATAGPQNARGARTRAALLEAIHQIVEDEGFEALTMSEVAKRAGVSRRAVYLHFSNRSELIPALHDYVVEVLGLEDSLTRVWDEPDPVAALDEWAGHLVRVHIEAMGVDRTVRSAMHHDPDVADYRAAVGTRQRRNCRMLIENLDAAGRLSSRWDLDTGTDMLWALISTDLLEALYRERGWSKDAIREHLSFLLKRTFVAD
ncbi:TetR/AcrR family transcriptional regulator [Stackebrandtia nassauensis]|uniref:Transcriptional regulator, TetR family n=1 Tax=Stackebrandtia nassauensis (strain DSM 44728 / CIP 108903 / NRRL B-16338 / NBRC 102104 / LLR-40K-21) TaxID=446470 RepID=D3PYL8_STANL|nr:TetR/AcrR family transcriptional regulator [Stackebrandtia nassauensis]ADD43451.1 transcriptional regulator, TetR family [Stackebrandtia nassauensis DSM 44728]